MKVIIFGAGAMYTKMCHMFRNMQILTIVDNDRKKQGTVLDGHRIESPDSISKYNYDFIILVGKHYKDMKKQLLEKGIASDKILDEEHKGIFDGAITLFSFSPKRIGNKKIALVSHDMSLTGAPIVLLTMAEVLKKRGYLVDVLAACKGQLIFSFIKSEIGVVLYRSLDLEQCHLHEIFDKYDYIVINTVTMHQLVKRVAKLGKPVIWWLHEEDDVYEQYNIKPEELLMPENVHIFGVGNRARESYKKYSKGRCIPELLYGIEEDAVQQKSEKRKKLIFALIGAVCHPRKGEDVLHHAIRNRWNEWKEKAEFWLIGAIPETLRKEYEEENIVKVFGSVEHDEVLKLMSEIDVIVCPSRNDPMPVVLTEGMMFKKVCIASDMTGTAEKIVPYENGLICQAGDVESLEQQIQWVIDHRDKLDAIGNCAYETYQEEFSIDKFETKVLEIVKNVGVGERES